MGGSGKWIKSLVGIKAPAPSSSSAEAAGKGRKWTRLFRSNSSSASRSSGGASPCDTSSASSASALSSVVAAVARAPPADFRVIRQEWAAVRVQAAFRGFLARRALKALRGIVRLQALVRGRLVRRQLAVTLTRMQALLRVQERAMERRARCSADAGDSRSHGAHSDRSGRADHAREAEEQWCDRQGSINDVKSRMQMKHEGAVKRQRAIAYAHSQQRRSAKYSGRPSSPASSLRNHESYVEGWMATKPWESRHMDANLGESHRLRNYDEMKSEGSKFSDASSIKIRRNDDTTRVEAKPPPVPSPSSSDYGCDECFQSTSSLTPESATNTLASEERSDSGHGVGEPSYMSLTKSAKARLDGCSGSRTGKFQIQRQRSGGMPYYRRVALSSLDLESNTGSDISAASRSLNNMSLKGRSMTRSLDKENENWF
ncbi:protein IQ-DOMAIN 6-like isoform X1 [Lolium perenne]|uniref:protein IQ-DOMAIN 6-like isoform X1 n=1 Tax=Lolium perenne TaxID=4522 RepID=UPI0021F5F374|nr:protein IQ-DOMAIN 6-like isoform X1 [Lolium perenne]